jgi:hypothetical protein
MKRIALLILLLAPTAAGAASLTDLSWLSGAWSGTQGNVTAEEYWSPATGTLMTSVHRDLKEGRTFSFEFLRIEQRNDSLTYIAMPRGRNETRFPLESLAGKKVVFANLAHDYPQRILYWLDDKGSLHARTEGTIKGKLESEEWTWERSKP